MKIAKKSLNLFLIILILIICSFIGLLPRERKFSKYLNKPKYFIYECVPQIDCGGWGDRLKGFKVLYSLINCISFYKGFFINKKE